LDHKDCSESLNRQEEKAGPTTTSIYKEGDESSDRQEEKAAWSDDAIIPYNIWNNRIWELGYHDVRSLQEFRMKFSNLFCHKYSVTSPCLLMVLRHFLLRLWNKNVYSDLKEFMMRKYGKLWVAALKLVHAYSSMVDVLYRVCRASFWEWSNGSALTYWQWPVHHQEHTLKGHPFWVTSELPRYRRSQKAEKDVGLAEKIGKKLSQVWDRQYVEKGQVSSLTGYFSVPKGEGDVHIVYNMSKSGLNRYLHFIFHPQMC
jgi:hypothetical protein